MFGYHFIEFGIGVALAVALIVALETGFRLGRRTARRNKEMRGKEPPSGGQIGAVQGAVLGLLGLLLGFSFAGAASRFLERQDLIMQEANAIGTAYLRADLLDEPHSSQMKDVLREYVRHRLEASKTLAKGLGENIPEEVALLHSRLWTAARDGALAKPSTMVAVLNPVNEVIDFHSTRVYTGKKHLPALVMGLLILCSMMAVGAIGYGCGLSGHRSLPMTLPLVILIAATLWTTIDLDHPRAGLIRLSDAPLEELDFAK
ncbi:MAG TPA: hypothetical protein VG797_03685 [Phycisphaerales bacterium]|nr:hypothetical protein [Phycisphaerales bacterium]